MKTREMERALAAADPVGGGRLDGLDFEAMEGELLADLEDEQPAPSQAGTDGPRRLVLALGTATLAVAVTALVVLSSGSSTQPAAAEVLRRTAAIAAAGNVAPAPLPKEGQFVYAKEKLLELRGWTAGRQDAMGGPLHRRGAPGTYTALVPVVRESWSGPSAGREREVMGAPQFISPAERRRWQRAGSPLPGTFDPSVQRRDDVFLTKGGGRVLEARRGVYDIERPKPPGRGFGPNRGLPLVNKLPTRPEALRHAVQRNTTKGLGSADGKPMNVEETIEALFGILSNPSATPKLRAATFDALAEMPGIEVKTHATDLAGRKGDAIVFDDEDGFEDEYIFDPDTTAVLGERSVLVHPDDRIWQDKGLPPGLVFRDSAYLGRAVVDSTRQRGSAPRAGAS